jgi:predicted nuclease of predicted toxin-antitoxin system
VKLLLDANLSPQTRDGLKAAGHQAVHVADVNLLHADDEVILAYAAEHELVLVTADHDFAALLALRNATRPSVVHLRGVADQPPAVHLALLVDNLTSITDDLEAGAIVSLSPTRLAVRQLPILGTQP